MNRWSVFIFCVIASILAGCKPPVIQVDDPVEPKPETPAEAPREEPSAAALAVVETREIKHYLVLNDPWNRYFRSTPKVALIPDLSKGIASLLKEEQELIKAVLDSSSGVNSTSEYAALEEKIEGLKLSIPQAETSSGYVPRNSSRSYTYISSSGSTVYIRRSSGYYSGYYSVFHNKQKSSSPALVRSVEGIVHNTTLEDLDQRIDALQQIISQWSQKTSRMSSNGTEGIMRRANESYLVGLRDFAKEFVNIRSELRKIEEKQALVEQNKASILEEWQEFEATRLQILDDYLTKNADYIVKPNSDDAYELPADYDGEIIYICAIGDRTLYFELSNERNKMHPFVMVDVGSVDTL